VRRHLAIVPALNEAACIAGVIDDLRRHAPQFDVLVVDDGSVDDTAARAHQAGALVVQLPFNLGIGGAVQTGYRFAAEHCYDVAVQVDGDGQHAAGELGALLAHLEAHPDVDMVVGSRFLPSDAREAEAFRSSAARRLGIGVLRRLLRVLVGAPVTDPTSGFRMAGRRAIELFAADYPRDYPEVECYVMLRAHDLRAAEVPVAMRERQGGRSSIGGLHSALYMVKVTLAIVMGRLRTPPTVGA
jgi:glycosyltransferase involved in cell wall biosynthesis